MRKFKAINLLWLLLSAVIIAGDRITKLLIIDTIKLGDGIEVIPDWFYIAHTRNTGAAWGIFGEHTEYLALFSVVAILALAYMLMFTRRNLAKVSLALVIGGAVGNAIDRIGYGYVTDFIDVYIFGYDFPAFNVADATITVGAIILIIYLLFMHNEMQT